MRLPIESARKTAFGEKMQSATEREYNAALRNAPRARKEHIDGGKRSMTVEHKDRGTLVASKTILYSRGKVSQEMYMVNPDYLPGGSMARQAKKKLPEELKKHQFTSDDNPNPKGSDRDGDGETGEKKPFETKGKKALLPIERAMLASEQQAEKLEAEAEANEAQADADRQKADAARMRSAKFPKGQKMTVEEVAEYFRAAGNDKAADDWLAMHEKNKDVIKDKMRGKKASLRMAARLHFAGRRYDYDEVIDFLTEDKSTPDLERKWKKWSEMVEDLHDRWFEGWAEANAPELLDESIDYKELAWKAFGSTTGMGIGLWEGDFLGDKHDEAFEKVVERDSKVSRFGQDLDDEISMAREGDDEESMRMASRRKMIRKAFVPDSVDAWLEWEDGTRTAASKTASWKVTVRHRGNQYDEVEDLAKDHKGKVVSSGDDGRGDYSEIHFADEQDSLDFVSAAARKGMNVSKSFRTATTRRG